MKKISLILLIFAIFLVFSCDGLVNNLPNGNDDENSSSIENNLSESKGTNELANKTFEDSTTKIQFTFSDSTVNIGSSNSETEDENSFAKSKFNYSYNSNSNPKTLELQLAGVFENSLSSEVSEYDEQITASGVKYDLLSTILLAALDSESIYEGVKELGNEYVEKIKNSVTSKAGSYVDNQKSILNDFLKTKYESVIHFGYELNSDALILSEKFNGDLSSASSKFVGNYGDAIITLNDYNNAIPFKIEIPKDDGTYTVYIGLPNWEDTTDISGKITVDMFSYPGNMFESSTQVINNICTDISSAVTETLIGILLSEDVEDIKNELDSNNSSEILDSGLDSVIGSFKFEANYQINENELTLTFTENGRPNFLSDSGNLITLNYTPLLGATYNIVK